MKWLFLDGGWGGYSAKLSTGSLPPLQGPALTFLYTVFDRKDTSFVYLPSRIGTPLTNLLVIRINRWNRKSSWKVFLAFNKINNRPFGCMLQSYGASFRYFNSWIPSTFNIPETWKITRSAFSPSRWSFALLSPPECYVNDWINITKIFQGVLLEIFTAYIVTYCIVL